VSDVEADHEPVAQLETSGRKGPGHRIPRLPVVIAVLGLLVGGGLIDRRSAAQTRAAGPEIRPMPVAAPLGAISSTWFCGGALGQPAKVADGQIVIANTLDRPLHGTVTFVTSDTGSFGSPPAGPSTTTAGGIGPGDTEAASSARLVTDVTVGARDRLVVAETAAGKAAFVGATVDLDGGGAAVQQIITGAEGVSSTACASIGSDRWYFADGTTQEHSNLYLTLVDPYSEDAIVDLSFSTEQGPEAPADFQGIVIGAGSAVGIDVGTHLRQRARVATTVTARAGRVIAFKTQVVPPALAGQVPAATPSTSSAVTDASPPRPPGLSLVLGSPSTGTSWFWPQGLITNGLTERYRIYNPGDTPADVVLTVALDEGSADPFKLTVGPHSVATVTTNNESRIQKGVGRSAILRSGNGVGVVAERTMDAVSPSVAIGLTDTLGSRLSSNSWLLPAGVADASFNASVIIQNPGLHPAGLSILGLQKGQAVTLQGLSSLSIPPGGRLVVSLNDHSPTFNEALLVKASTDVVVERDESRVKGIGLDATMGVPVTAS
jgi:hypothetical protein